MDRKQVRLDALRDVYAAIGEINSELPPDIDPGMIGTDTRRLALEDAHEAIQRLISETWDQD